MLRISLLIFSLIALYKASNTPVGAAPEVHDGVKFHNNRAGVSDSQGVEKTIPVGSEIKPADPITQQGGSETHTSGSSQLPPNPHQGVHNPRKSGGKGGDDKGHVEGADIKPDESSKDEEKDEILSNNYRLPVGFPWKEECYTSDWMYSENYPGLTAEVHWFCPFYVQPDATDPKARRRRGEDDECVTTVHLKYYNHHQESATDVLLDTFKVTYIATFVMNEENVLQFIVPQSVQDNKVVVNVAFNYHSEKKTTCKQFTYEIGEQGAVKTTTLDLRCDKLDSLTTTEWLWEAADDDEDADFDVETRFDEKDQDDEEEEHMLKHAQETRDLNIEKDSTSPRQGVQTQAHLQRSPTQSKPNSH